MKVVLFLAFIVSALAVLPWPEEGIDACNNKSRTSQEIIAPQLVSWSIEPAGTTGEDIDQLDRLKLVWKLHASYAVEHIWGQGKDTAIYATNTTSIDGFTRVAYYYGPEQTDCYGQITLEIWLGALAAWGFVGAQDETLHQWNLTGSLWINTTRWIVNGEADMLQVVTVTFPILITVATQYQIDPTQIKVFGTGKVSGSIILFKEHEYPSKVVTIYYLLSVQYPYKFATLPVASVTPTNNAIAPQDPVDMWYYVNDRVAPAEYCKGIDTNGANWCYQVVHVDYLITDDCQFKSNHLDYDGTYRLDLELGCRDGLDPADWTCEMPAGQDWVHPYLTFSVSSNNICEKFLNYDGTSITGKLNVYAQDKPALANKMGTDWDTNYQSTFVPDNPAYFVIDLSVSSSFGFQLTKLKVLNISFWKDGYPEPAIYDLGTWSAHGLQLSPQLNCSDDAAAKCKLADGLPTAWWKLVLAHNSYLDLTGKVAMKLECVAYIEITYDWKTTSNTETVMFSTGYATNIAPGIEIYTHQSGTNPFGPASLPSAPAAAGSITGTVVGVVVGAAALIAAVSAFVVFKMKNKNVVAQVDSTSA